MKNLIIIVALLMLAGCSSDDSNSNVQSELVGEELFTVRSDRQSRLEVQTTTDPDNIIEPTTISLGTVLNTTYQGFVSPGYGNGRTSVEVTFTNVSGSGVINYNGMNYGSGESFNVVEWFPSSNSVTSTGIRYVAQNTGQHEWTLTFTTNFGSQKQILEFVFVNE